MDSLTEGVVLGNQFVNYQKSGTSKQTHAAPAAKHQQTNENVSSLAVPEKGRRTKKIPQQMGLIACFLVVCSEQLSAGLCVHEQGKGKKI